ncbi:MULTISPECIES: acetylglutamate/acetylaminoadipate kinase [Halomicrobium]|uniref:Putative [LysW]-aminoadipate/[LysW]-glutamate kinase n=2 Tax=Halomicrobium mukohataei TaxID=57705 RepID=C7NZZ7_HALMD|nr:MULTISPECIES: acetylglutamate/acetylaminoadipate kinase [Halomicrobium]ACV46905.1 acetylglutamate kinase [Halomicrobium mukohataei DSM 12286]QCD65405.1 acetylglutamate/acetylaminoadipate kinase [Halomicrobium mukohataei]QFR20211.1 acetylglutamate/acetylaminoadipate kinase [Halomicrobium sp. ZPS1]
MTVVIKVGGARAVDPAGALSDVASLYEDGEDVVLVHGGSTAVDDTLERLGIEPEYVETPSGVVGRFTDEATMEVFEMVFGHLNTQLVAGLQSLGVDAVGLSGVDGKLLHGPRKSAVRVVEDGTKKIRRGDHSGTIKEVNTDLLWSLLDGNYLPVAAPPMAGDDDGEIIPVNTDADRTAAAIAAALDAKLVLLTDVAGVYEDPDDPETLIETVETGEEWQALEAAAEGFMSRKIMAAREALDGGAPEVVVADANADTPVTDAVNGDGTHMFQEAIEEL